jgi:hypothetical protein
MQVKAIVVTIMSTVICTLGSIANGSASQRLARELPHVCNIDDGHSYVCDDDPNNPFPYDCSSDGVDDCDWVAEAAGCPDMQCAEGDCSSEDPDCENEIVCYKQL